jgi:hypothetical protein
MIVAALPLLLALSACASDANTGLTLAQTKSPVQLLRNAAASRVPSTLVAKVENSSDSSENCRTPETDPEGLQRSWKSSVRIVLTPEADLKAVLSKVYVSFREDGWEQGTYGSAAIVEFTRDDSIADIHISVKEARDGDPAELQMKVSGPCVMTDGEGSDEVTRLEVAAD